VALLNHYLYLNLTPAQKRLIGFILVLTVANIAYRLASATAIGHAVGAISESEVPPSPAS